MNSAFFMVGRQSDGTPILVDRVFAPGVRQFLADQLRRLASAIKPPMSVSPGERLYRYLEDGAAQRHDITSDGRAVSVSAPEGHSVLWTAPLQSFERFEWSCVNKATPSPDGEQPT